MSCLIHFYVPAWDEEALKGAIGSGADVIVMDLEEATPQGRKEEGRALTRRALREIDFKGAEKWVRVNPVGSPELERDLQGLDGLPAGIVMPRAASAQDLLILAEKIVLLERRLGLPLGRTPILPTIETAEGLLHAHEIAGASSRVSLITLGGGDLLRDLGGLRTPEGGELFYARARLAVEARAAGVRPMDTVTPAKMPDDYLERETREAFRLGFVGRGVLTSRHIGPIRKIYAEMRGET